jgi:hypothetical protein
VYERRAREVDDNLVVGKEEAPPVLWVRRRVWLVQCQILMCIIVRAERVGMRVNIGSMNGRDLLRG